jgi:hypothetical protein
MTRVAPRPGRRLLTLCLLCAAPAVLGLCAASADASGAAGASGGAPVWVASAPGPGGAAAAGRVVVRDAGSGALYVAGDARVSATASEIMVVKYDAAGGQQWVASYGAGAAGPQTAVAGAIDKAGDFIVLCAVDRSRTGGDWAVLEYRPNGTRRWATTISGAGAGNDVPGALAVCPSGAIYAAGGLCAAGGGSDAAVVRLTAAGKVVWRRALAGGKHGAARFSALGLDGAGRVYCAGTATGAAAPGADCLLSAWSPAGRRLWAVKWGGAAHLADGVDDLVVTAAGKAYAVGWFGTTSGSCAMIRQYDAGGRCLWQSTYTTKGGGRDRFVAAGLLPHGGLVATGSFVGTATGDSNIVTVGVGVQGASLWRQIWDSPHSLGGFSDDQAQDVAVDAGGHVFVCGSVPSGVTAGTDFAVLAYTAAGAPLWNAALTWDGGAGDDTAWALAPAPGGVVVTGQARPPGGQFQMTTADLSY